MRARLEAAPAAFELAEAAWLAERLSDGTPPRFRGSLARGFPAGGIDALRLAGDGAGESRAELVSAAFTLGGPFGPLPTPLSEDAALAAREGAGAARALLDHLNQRLFELLLALLRLRDARQQPGAPFDSAAARALFAVMGLASAGLRREVAPPGRERMDGTDRMALRFAGLAGRRVRTLDGL
ncbi:MAG: type VI secretion system baseplate subunit TssG, partial [Alphaproteobacteria bacterium]